MKYFLVLMGATVAAHYIEHNFSVYSRLVVRNPEILINPASRLQRRGDRVSRGSSPSAISITGPPSSRSISPSGFTPPSSRSSSPSPSENESRNLGWPSAKASVCGLGYLRTNDERNRCYAEPIHSGTKGTIYSTNQYIPAASAASSPDSETTRRWPIKASGNGRVVVAALATGRGSGHILLSGPDQTPHQFNVPSGRTTVVTMSSNVPGGAKARVVGSKGSSASVWTSHEHHRHVSEQQLHTLARATEINLIPAWSDRIYPY